MKKSQQEKMVATRRRRLGELRRQCEAFLNDVQGPYALDPRTVLRSIIRGALRFAAPGKIADASLAHCILPKVPYRWVELCDAISVKPVRRRKPTVRRKRLPPNVVSIEHARRILPPEPTES